jgi:hypothetical protein
MRWRFFLPLFFLGCSARTQLDLEPLDDAGFVALPEVGIDSGRPDTIVDTALPVDRPDVLADCPLAEPAPATTCSVDPSRLCVWAGKCGKVRGRCASGRWSIERDPCPDKCPEARPALGSTCRTEGLTCSWKNDCGKDEKGVCTAGKWRIDAESCGGACPAIPPREGVSCPRRTTCIYWVDWGTGELCRSACECSAAGAAWKCGAGICK